MAKSKSPDFGNPAYWAEPTEEQIRQVARRGGKDKIKLNDGMNEEEIALTAARTKVTGAAENFLAVGVPGKKIAEAAVDSEQKAKAELEAKEKENPILDVAEVLSQSAETQREHQMAEAMTKMLEIRAAEVAKKIGSSPNPYKEFKSLPETNDVFQNASLVESFYLLNRQDIKLTPPITDDECQAYCRKIIRALEPNFTITDEKPPRDFKGEEAAEAILKNGSLTDNLFQMGKNQSAWVQTKFKGMSLRSASIYGFIQFHLSEEKIKQIYKKYGEKTKS